MVAAFLVLRLRKVLGRRTGQERPPNDPYSAKPKTGPAENSDRVVALPTRGDRRKPADQEESADPLQAGLSQIRAADSEFDVDQFTEGAKSALEFAGFLSRRNISGVFGPDHGSASHQPVPVCVLAGEPSS